MKHIFQKKPFGICMLGLFCLASLCLGKEKMGQRGKLVYQSDFSNTDRAPWTNGQIVDGYLKMAKYEEGHGAIFKIQGKRDADYIEPLRDQRDVFPEDFSEGVIEFDFRFIELNLAKVLFNDGHAGSYCHAGHICRVLVFANGRIDLVDDIGGFYGKRQTEKDIDGRALSDTEKSAEKMRVSDEYYSDPESKTVTVKRETFEKGRWYRFRVEVRGSELSFYCDDELVAKLDSPGKYEGYLSQPEKNVPGRANRQPRGIDHYKSEWGFNVKGGEAHIDNVKVWEVR